MSERLRAGAYIIRNKYRSLVLHAQIAEFGKEEGSSVVVIGRDESVYRYQQIWWIEPIPYQEHINSYMITNTGTGQALELTGGKLEINKNVGGARQRWWIERFTGDDERIYYNIISIGDERIMHITPADVGCGRPALCTGDGESDSDTQSWEFLKPVVAIPPGWVRIMNISTGHVLCHDYNTSPPVLIPPPAQLPPQYRETWGTQWCFHKILNPGPWNDKATARLAWVVKNRLTDAVLHVQEDKYNVWTVQASGNQEYNEYQSWSLEFDEDGNWIIRNEEMFCLLEEGSKLQGQIPGNELICKDKRFSRTGGKSWLIRSVVEVDDGSPVDACGPVDAVPVRTPAPNIQVMILPHNHPQVEQIKGELYVWNRNNSEQHTLDSWAWHCHREDQAILVLGQGKETVEVGRIKQKTGVVKFRRELFLDTKLRMQRAITILGRGTEDGEKEITTIIFE
ncbi:hypothetical protein P167DRAFT_569101 [Morchella conica CCBAS932]|uniref:Ricin B lectin domain-containing protein n=1 Tax=Morchella conica CCBAS932 TaxID=1392247 RepID=A0A3N4KB33_9PEZI|nr:hypothetical protein P167DRAFT_569101 [Morchella conica CCBAS932]